MNLLQKIVAAVDPDYRVKWVDFPTITGGMEIFSRFLDWDGGWSESKRMSAYKKSLYVFACVYKIAQKTASIDWEFYKIINKAGDKKQLFVHDGLNLLYKPNPFQTKEEFFQRFMINKKLAGHAFILKVRESERGPVRELWNLRPDFMRIILDPTEIIKGYEFSHDGKTTLFAPEDIIHDSYPDPLTDFGGMSPLQPAQSRIDTEEFATKYQKNFFVNNARPDFVLMTDKKLGADQKEEMRESWDKRHKGEKNTSKGAFLEGGLKYQQVSISQREMDYIESLRMTRDDILVAFQVPKPIVAITDDVNLANAKTAMEIFLSETIVPEIKQLTNKLNEHLIYPEYGDIYYINFEDPVPENKVEKADIQTKRLASGTMLINEAREEWGDPPIAGGNTLYQPLNMVPVGGMPQNTPEKSMKQLPDKRKNVFRGRARAYKIMQLKDHLAKKMREDLRGKLKKELAEGEAAPAEEVTGKGKSLILPEIRENYGDVVVKAIDKRGESMQKRVTDFMVGEQKKRVLKALKLNNKDMGAKVVDDVKGALKSWAKDEKKLAAKFSIPFIEEFVRESGNDAMALVAPAETFDVRAQRVQDFIKQRANEFGKETTATTMDKLARTLSEGIASDEGIAALSQRVDDVYEEFPTYRSEMIARTEATASNNEGFKEAYRQSGVANAKEWIATNDSRTREEHRDLDGEIVALDANFSNGLEYPQEPNCRCVLGPAFLE